MSISTLKKQWDSSMKIQKSWAVLISQTGSEVIAISKETGFLPGLVITNNLTKVKAENLEILRENGAEVREIPFRPTVKDYIESGLLDKQLITLHGFLRILPAEFLNEFKGKMYNGHPALITEYPELKGLNKQEDIFYHKEKYPTCGSVVHEVIPELDSGEVLVDCQTVNTCKSLNEAYEILRETSLASWVIFFTKFWKFE